MTTEAFFELFLEELRGNPTLTSYYKFLNDGKGFEFRKAYFIQRLDYIFENIKDLPKDVKIWDCGCGYGTTAIFLALNGYKIFGNTLEFYFSEIPGRLEYWSQFGDVSGFKADYQDLYEIHFEEKFDVIIAQDTLHHLEPLNKALCIMKDALSENGKILAIEENGSNVVQNFKLYLRRGNKKIIEIYDERLDKKILIGNENIRSKELWDKELNIAGLKVNAQKTKYIRLYPPFFYKGKTMDKVIEKEQSIWRKNNFLKKYFFFGLNFIIEKDSDRK